MREMMATLEGMSEWKLQMGTGREGMWKCSMRGEMGWMMRGEV
jgi:hypothetical protein